MFFRLGVPFIGIVSWYPIVLCSPSLRGGGREGGGGLLWEHSDHIVALWWGNPFACVLLAVNLVFHEEMSLLLQVDLAVCAGVALRVAELIPQLHHQAPAVVEGGSVHSGASPGMAQHVFTQNQIKNILKV